MTNFDNPPWSAEEIGALIDEYPTTQAKILGVKLNRSEKAIWLKAYRLRLKRVFHMKQRGKRILKPEVAA